MNEYTHDKTVAIILAAGFGHRMISGMIEYEMAENPEDCPKKQYMELLGRPVLCYTLDAFEASKVDEICLVVSPGDEDYVRNEFVEKYGYRKVTAYVDGGAERYLSVYNCLQVMARTRKKTGDSGSACYVLIHDAARSLITPEMVNYCIEQVSIDKAVVMGVPSKDTIRVVNDERWSEGTPHRKHMWIAQTPQCFVFQEIYDAFQKLIASGDTAITDDGMVMEKYGERKVRVIEGNYENIKITTPDDVMIGETILAKRMRTGSKYPGIATWFK